MAVYDYHIGMPESNALSMKSHVFSMARSASKPLRSSEFFDPGITSPISFDPPDVFFLCSRGLLTLCFFVDSMIRRSLLEGLSFNRPALDFDEFFIAFLYFSYSGLFAKRNYEYSLTDF